MASKNALGNRACVLDSGICVCEKNFECRNAGFGIVLPAGEMLEFVSTGVWKGGHTWKRLAHGRIGGLCDDYISC